MQGNEFLVFLLFTYNVKFYLNIFDPKTVHKYDKLCSLSKSEYLPFLILFNTKAPCYVLLFKYCVPNLNITTTDMCIR